MASHTLHVQAFQGGEQRKMLAGASGEARAARQAQRAQRGCQRRQQRQVRVPQPGAAQQAELAQRPAAGGGGLSGKIKKNCVLQLH